MKVRYATVPIDILRESIAYDPESGLIRTLKPLGKWRLGEYHAGYRRTRVAGRKILVHRIAAALMTGEWRDENIDHENHNGSDNRWVNLRHANHSRNAHNRKRYTGCTLPKGVKVIHPPYNYIQAGIRVDRKNIHLGTFKTMDEAAHAYNVAAVRAFGEFACINPVGVDPRGGCA